MIKMLWGGDLIHLWCVSIPTAPLFKIMTTPFEKIKHELGVINKAQNKINKLQAEILKEPGFENYGPAAVAAYAGKVQQAILDEY
jgi:hypothetical protein